MRGRGHTRQCGLGRRLLLVCLGVSSLNAQQFVPRDENPEDFPAGTGRDDTFYACTACHGFKLIAQQGMSRRQWEESIELMVRRHNMPPLSDKDQKIVLDYLEATYPPRVLSRLAGAGRIRSLRAESVTRTLLRGWLLTNAAATICAGCWCRWSASPARPCNTPASPVWRAGSCQLPWRPANSRGRVCPTGRQAHGPTGRRRCRRNTSP